MPPHYDSNLPGIRGAIEKSEWAQQEGASWDRGYARVDHVWWFSEADIRG